VLLFDLGVAGGGAVVPLSHAQMRLPIAIAVRNFLIIVDPQKVRNPKYLFSKSI
jgi:hypothetical protein